MKCPVCLQKTDFIQLKGFICKTNNFLCKKCGLVFLPRDSEKIYEYYKKDGYFKKSLNVACKKQLISKSFLIKEAEGRVKNALGILSADIGGSRVLDVGCGYGEILYVLKNKYNCKVSGVEASSETAKHGSGVFSIQIQVGVLEELALEGKPDIIWCSHVLEHVGDPGAFLRKTKTLLDKDGLLYLEVPNILRPTGGFALDMFLYAEHLQTFSAYNLYLILEKSGFNIVRYSDSNFLRFWCRLQSKHSQKLPKVSAEKILEFLNRYKNEYGIADWLRVYSQKALYGGKLAFYKARDIF